MDQRKENRMFSVNMQSLDWFLSLVVPDQKSPLPKVAVFGKKQNK